MALGLDNRYRIHVQSAILVHSLESSAQFEIERTIWNLALRALISMADQVEETALVCACGTCQAGDTAHKVEDDEFEFDYSDAAHWAFACTGDAAGDFFLDYCGDSGLLQEGPHKVQRLFEFGKACEALGSLEEIRAAMLAWRLQTQRGPRDRSRSPKRDAPKRVQ
jgi:hypothetical protein